MTRADSADRGRATAPVMPDGVAFEPLVRFLRERVPDAGELTGAELIGGGRSNLTYRLLTAGNQYVLRRPPLGHILPTAHDVGREYRFISALAGSEVPVPRAAVFCEDNEVIGAPFYIMQYCPGRVLTQEWPEDYGGEAGQARACRVLIETLARLHAVDWQAAGLGDFARPGNFVERQVKRLFQQWELSDPDPLPAAEEVRRRLTNAVPPPRPPAIVHGDYGIHNVILAQDDPGRIAAVLDWEMATIGDPLADLGWLLSMWSNSEDYHGPAPEGMFGVTALPGFWTRERVIAEYGRASGRDMSHVEYYYVFGRFKLMVIWAGIHARFKAGVTRGEGFEQYGPRIPLAAERALAAADASSVPALRGEG